jgi:hypothetical protein
MKTSYLYLVCAVGTVGACKVDSTALTLKDIGADMKVVGSAGDSNEVTVFLQEGAIDSSLTFLDLKGEDKLYASTGGVEKALSRSSIFGVVGYSATFNGVGSNPTFTVRFDRGSAAGAPLSSCTMPSPFEIASPAISTKFSRGTQDIEVSYSPAGTTDKLRYKLSGSCIKTIDRTIDTADVGSFRIDRSLITLETGENTPSTCDVTLSVDRYSTGTLDAAFGKGGRIECYQRRERLLQTAP